MAKIHNKPVVVSLFCGIGSAATGYQQAGFNVALAVDDDEIAAQVFKQNHKGVPHLLKRIEQVSGDEIMQLAGVEKFGLDVLDACPPPCHLPTGKMLSRNEKIQTGFWDFGRLVEETMPKVFVASYNKSVLTGLNRLFFNETIELLSEIGYTVDYEVLNTQYYGIAQGKDVLIIVGVRHDTEIRYLFPEATENFVTTREAIEDLLDTDCDIPINLSHLTLIQKYFRSGISQSAIKELVSRYNLNLSGMSYRRDRWDEPSYELLPSLRLIHPVRDRYLSVNEALRLQSFPEEYVLSGHPDFDWERVTAAVPPLLMKIVAQNIKKHVLDVL